MPGKVLAPVHREQLLSALAAWYAADDRARDLEQRVRDASLTRETLGTPVSAELLREMVRARGEANALLRDVVALAPLSAGDPEREPDA